MDQRSEETNSPNADIQGALAALKAGDQITARRLAEQAAALTPDNEAPWLILAALSDPEESVVYALRALEANPESQPARQALAWAQGRLGTGPLVPRKPHEEPPQAETLPEEEVQPEVSAAPEPIPAESATPLEEIQPEVIPVAAESAALSEEVLPEVSPAPEAIPVESATPAEEVQPEAIIAPEPAPAESAAPPTETITPFAPPLEKMRPPLSRSARWLIAIAVLLVILIVLGLIFLPPLVERFFGPTGYMPSVELGVRAFAALLLA